MNGQELRSLVEHMVLELAGQPNAAAPTKAAPTPVAAAAGGCLDDITEIDLQWQYLVKNSKNSPASLGLKLRTPVRLGLEWAGTRYKTMFMLHIRTGHAAAQDLVFLHVDGVFVEENGFVPIQTLCQNKDEYLTCPDRGRRLDEVNQTIIKEILGRNPKMVLTVGDDLSSVAIEANTVDCIQAIQAGPKTYGLENGPALFIKYCRVGAPGYIRELTDVETVRLLVGERPGLATVEPMSAYLIYRLHIGISESKCTVTSNIHRQGTTAVKAGVHVAELIEIILEKKVNGIDLRRSASVRFHGACIVRINVLSRGQNPDAG